MSSNANLQTNHVGQCMAIGFDGTEMTDGLRRLISDLHLGGLVLFQRNVESPAQLARLVADAQQVAREAGLPPLLICIDQEGGRVARLRREQGFAEFSSAQDIGTRAAQDGLDVVRDHARAIAQPLRAAGINVNLAPVLDVNNNPHNPVINTRAFGADAVLVAQCGVAYIEAMQTEGVWCVGKHFPGHGDVAVDSHIGLPVVPHGRERLEQIEFAPFVAAMRAGVAGIMSAHVSFPAIEPGGLPATLSPRVMTHLLREELNYDGLLFTDSLEMGALASSGFPVPEAAVAALQAGADVLLFNAGEVLHRKAFDALKSAAQAGQLAPQRLDTALARINRLKATLV